MIEPARVTSAGTPAPAAAAAIRSASAAAASFSRVIAAASRCRSVIVPATAAARWPLKVPACVT